MRVSIFCHIDGTISTNDFELTDRDLNKGYKVQMGDGYTLQCTRGNRHPVGNEIIAHVHGQLDELLYAVNISRPGMYILDDHGHTYAEVTIPAREPVPA